MDLRSRVLTTLLLMWWAGGASGAPGGRLPLKDGDLFDYIVVGAGAAGSALAARLAQAGREVLLVEAGGSPGLLSKMPKAAMALMGSEVDWFYETEPNNVSCLAHRGRRCRFSRGRCLGGSTSINYMLYTRGNQRDYDFSVPGWSWRDLKPYFLRYEGLRDPGRLPLSSRPYHNSSGPVRVGPFGRSGNPWSERIVEGLAALGFPINRDVNGKSQIGVSRVLGYVAGGERVSAASAFLRRRDVGRALTVAAETRCTGVVIDEDNVARGVTVVRGRRGGGPIAVYARREVILTAGTIGSAQLLMLSGVGDAGHLRRLGVPVRADLPVGDGMSDHVLPLLFVKVDHDSAVPNWYGVLGAQGLDVARWLVTRGGPMASVGVTDVVAFANARCYDFESHRLRHARPECDVPTLQIIFAYVERYISHVFLDGFARVFDDDVFAQIRAANEKDALLIVSPVLLRPRSRGRMRLASVDPAAPPVIDPAYLSDAADVADLVEAIALVEEMLRTPAFSRNNASLVKFRLAGCPGAGEPGYWECYVRHMTGSAQHAVGTAPLGPVVDAVLRVRGVRALRVADLSVLPLAPRGNTAAVAMALGERLADMLLS